MGICKLNKFLKHYAPNSIKPKTLYQLKNKIMAIDFSIFYYKFKKSKSNRTLLESFNYQIETFNFYKITPIYIFDGKPDENKSETINERNREIKKYKDKLNYENNPKLLEKYEKKTVKLNNYDINNCKKLFKENNVKYIQASGEADNLCCQLYKDNKIYGIFTEDNDLLLGGGLIFKGLNNFNDRIFEYNITNILYDLNISYNIFLRICLLSGSTYTKKIDDIFNLYENYTKNNRIDDKYSEKQFLYNKYVPHHILV